MSLNEGMPPKVGYHDPIVRETEELKEKWLKTEEDKEVFERFQEGLYDFLSKQSNTNMFWGTRLGGDLQAQIWQLPRKSLQTKLKVRFEYASLSILDALTENRYVFGVLVKEITPAMSDMHMSMNYFMRLGSEETKVGSCKLVETELLQRVAALLPEGDEKQKIYQLLRK